MIARTWARIGRTSITETAGNCCTSSWVSPSDALIEIQAGQIGDRQVECHLRRRNDKKFTLKESQATERRLVTGARTVWPATSKVRVSPNCMPRLFANPSSTENCARGGSPGFHQFPAWIRLSRCMSALKPTLNSRAARRRTQVRVVLRIDLPVADRNQARTRHCVEPGIGDLSCQQQFR